MQRTTRRDGLKIFGRGPEQIAKLRLELVADWYHRAELVDVLLRGFFDTTDTDLLV